LRDGAAQRLARQQFEHGLLIGVLAALLARRHGLDPHRALITGMVHDLGALAVALYLEDRPEARAGDDACAVTQRRLRAVIGPALLTRLGFDGAMARTSEQAEHWHRDETPPGEADLLVAAHVVAALEDPAPQVPAAAQVPAFARVCPGGARRDALDLLRRAFRLCASLRRRLE
jgi:HD-like signal output (HDOD) protein